MNNHAKTQGGSIYYNYKRPILTQITHINNTAQYGPEIASYAVKIVQKNTPNNKIILNGVGSNIEFDEDLELELIDYDGQVMNLENTFTVTILENDPSIEVKGTNTAKFVNGTALFDNLIFVGVNGRQNALYKVVTRSIDQSIVNAVLDNSNDEYNNTIDVSFRHCKPGEIKTADYN